MERVLLLFALLMIPAWVSFLMSQRLRAEGHDEQAKALELMALLLCIAFAILIAIVGLRQ